MFPLSLMPVILLVVCVSSQTEPELLIGTSCEKVYKEALGNRTSLNFSAPIGNITCQRNNNDLKYQCFVDEHQREFQWCTEWHWMEPGLCPKYYILSRKLNPVPCNIEGCPKVQYMSHEYYKYPVCFNLSLSRTNSGRSGKQGNDPTASDQEKNVSNSSNAGTYIGVSVTVVILGVGTFIFCYCRRKKKTDSRTDSKNLADTTESPLLPTCKDNFFQKRPFEAMQECIKQGRHIVLTGLPGSGASTLLDQMRNSHQGMKWHTEKHGKLHFKRRHVKFIVFDQSGLQELIVNHSPEDISRKMAEVEGETTVIMNVDYEWYTQSVDILKQCLGKAYDIIDLSSEKHRLDNLEKRQYLDFLCEENGIIEAELPEEKRQVISAYKESSKGFPLLCSELINSKKFDDPEAYLKIKDSGKGITEKFLQRRAFESIEDCIKQKCHIVLTGIPGSGVSTLMEQLRKSHQGKEWHNEKHGELHFKSRTAEFVVFDHSGLLKLLAKYSSEDISKEMMQVQGRKTVIVNIEYEWYTKYPEKISQCLGKKYKIIDLSSEKYRLNKLEKRQYLDFLCEKNGITEGTLSEEKRQVIASYKESNKGFLLLCLDLINSGAFDNPDAFLKLKDLKKGILQQDRPLNAAKLKLDAGRHVLVTGLPGSGISTFLEHLKSKCQNWDIVKYKTLRLNKKQKGVVEIDHDIVKDLMKSDELNKLKDRILDAPGCAFIMNVKYEWYQEYVDEFREKVEIPFDVIDLSSDEYKLNNEEKLVIVEKLCSDKGISLEKLSNEKRQEISSFDGSYCGFPQVLKEVLEEEEFENPIKRMEEIDEQHKK